MIIQAFFNVDVSESCALFKNPELFSFFLLNLLLSWVENWVSHCEQMGTCGHLFFVSLHRLRLPKDLLCDLDRLTLGRLEV